MANVFVSIDMEGIAGIAHLKQVWRGSDDFPASRELMTGEANAAVAGAFDGGATGVVVNDSHGDMYNLLAEKMDPRAELLIGSPKPLSMMQGFGAEFDVALFIGYHAGAGTQAAKRLSGIRTVVVKEAFGRNVARSMHPAVAREAIRKAAAEAVASCKELGPYLPDGPFVLEAEVANTSAADLCELPPGVERLGPRTVGFRTIDFRDAFRCLLAWTYLGASEAPRYAGT